LQLRSQQSRRPGTSPSPSPSDRPRANVTFPEATSRFPAALDQTWQTNGDPRPNEISAELDGIAASLAEVDSRSSERISSLSRALSSDQGVRHWSDVDLRRVFNVERLSHLYALRREGGYASGPIDLADKIRNVLVLVPILLTWAALAEAARSYSNYLAKNPDKSNQPFLLLWQQGFDGQAAFFQPTFSSVAILDAAIIVVIILLTFYSHGRKETREDKIADTASNFQAAFENVLAEASVLLATDRASRPQQLASSVESLAVRFERSTQELLTQLQVEHDRLESLAGRREKEFADFGVFASGLRAGADEMHRLLVDLRQVSTALESSLDDLSGEVSVAGDQQRSLLTAVGNLERVTSSAIQSDQTVMRQLTSAAHSLAETAEKTISGAESAAQASRAATDAVRGISQLAQQIADGQVRVEQSLSSETESNRRFAEALQATTQNSQITANTLGDVNDGLARIREEFERVGIQTGQHANVFNALLSQQAELSRGISEVARELGSSGLTSSQRQREVNEDLGHLVQRLDGLANTLNRMIQLAPNTENLEQAFAAALRSELGRIAGSGNSDRPERTPAATRPTRF
jgi:hypothetical protein